MEASYGVTGDRTENLRGWKFSSCSVDYFNMFSTGLNRYINASVSCDLIAAPLHYKLISSNLINKVHQTFVTNFSSSINNYLNLCY